MIEFSRVVLLGRTEPATEENRWIRHVADLHAEHAEPIFEWRWPEQIEDWDAWNVVALIGRYGSWPRVEFQRWEGLGESAVPVLRHALRYEPAVDRIDPVKVSRVNPPVLHRSWKLLPPSGEAHRPRNAPRSKPRPGWVDRLRALEIKLERLGLLDNPNAGGLRDWERLLSRDRVRIEQDPHGRFRLEAVPDGDFHERAS